MATAQHLRPMELEGSLKAFKFPEILQFLAMGRMTGVLSLDRAHESAPPRSVQLTFNEGRIVGANSEERYPRLGQMLVYAGRLGRQKLEEVLEEQSRAGTRRRLGSLLVEKNLITPEILTPLVRLQIEEEVFELFRWDEGGFRFEQGPVAPEGALGVSLEVEPLLLEGSRRLDEWHSISANIADPAEVYRVHPEFAGRPDLPLDEKTWRVLALVNGRLPVEAIVRLSNLGKFETYYALDQLLRAELITQVHENGPRDRSASEPRKSIVEMPAPVGGRGAAIEPRPSTDRGDEPPGIFRRVFRKKGGEAAGGAERNGEKPEATGSGQDHATDLGLVCAAVNQLIDEVRSELGSSSGSEDGPGSLARLWRESEGRFPKADMIEFASGRLDSRKYQRYVEFEGEVTPALLGAHDDGLEALAHFWKRLVQSAGERATREAALQIAERVANQYQYSRAIAAPSGFSFANWQRETVEA